jgi:hypothetical protein
MTMKLGILAVYMVREENEKLLELHLSRIEQHTAVPYTIYGSANRLLPKYRQTLKQHPRVRLYRLPATDLRGSEEHSYYLEHLVKLAIEDGASHIVTLHVDSFPIRDGWARALVGKLSESCVFSTIAGINTACLLFHRDFFLKYRPTFLLSEEVQESAEYRKYFQAVTPILHSGIGYGFRAFQEGLSWHSMRKSSRHEELDCPAIYDDLVIHLRGAVRLSDVPARRIPKLVRRFGYARFEAFQRAIHAITPTPVRLLFQTKFRRATEMLIDQTRIGWQFGDMIAGRDRLLQDPASYIEQLRGKS